MKTTVAKIFRAVCIGCTLSAAISASTAMAGHAYPESGYRDNGYRDNGYRHEGYRDRGYRGNGRHRDEQDVAYGKVIRAKPIYETRTLSVPRRECWDEQVTHRSSSDSATGTVLGSIIGAAVGHELGHHKSNQQVGAVVGAVLGGSIGRDVSRRDRGQPIHRIEQRCETVYDQRREQTVVGYRVKYVYRGQVYHTRTDYHPGDHIKLNVSVMPVR